MERFTEADAAAPETSSPVEPHACSTAVRPALEVGLQIIAFGILATLAAFATVEALRLAMKLSGANGPSHDKWYLLSGVQQVGWQFMPACYAVLLVGSALLRAGGANAWERGWAGWATLSIALAMAGRALLLGAGPGIQDFQLRAALVVATGSAEEWFLLAALLGVDMEIRALADNLGHRPLKVASTAHAILVVCLATGSLIPVMRGTVSATQLGVLLRLALGAICLAWSFRLVCDARSVLRKAGASSADQ